MQYHIIGDIHGHADKLEELLRRLGYRLRDGVYVHDDAKAVFLGDFIDRGPQQRRVVDIVRPMVESGGALAVMGNHEFNAIAYHTCHPATKTPLRPHTEKNTAQHRAFLEEYGADRAGLREVIEWFMRLPLYLEVKDEGGHVLFRAVHACWHPPAIERMPQFLDESLVVRASTEGAQAYEDVEVLLKGPEISLPEGYGFNDKSGVRRTAIRVRWWETCAGANYQDIALLPDGEESKLPDMPVDGRGACFGYGGHEPPVFFGHYWLRGEPAPIASNLACLDYSAGAGGPLAAYCWRGDDGGRLREECFVTAGG